MCTSLSSRTSSGIEPCRPCACYLRLSSHCCPQMNKCGAIHQSMINLPGGTPLNNADSSCFRAYQLSVTLPSTLECNCLLLFRSYAGSQLLRVPQQNCTVISEVDDFLESSLTTGAHHLPSVLFRSIPRDLGREDGN